MTAGANRKVKPSLVFSPFDAASSAARLVCRASRCTGFSHSTCLPASSAAHEISKCASLPVATSITSMDGSSSSCPVVRLDALDAELLGHPPGYLSVDVGDRDHLDARIALPSGDVGALGPAARSDNGDAKFFSAHVAGLFLSVAGGLRPAVNVMR